MNFQKIKRVTYNQSYTHSITQVIHKKQQFEYNQSYMLHSVMYNFGYM